MQHRDIILAFGDRGAACAAALNAELKHPVTQDAVYQWRTLNSIPAWYWPALMVAAKKIGVKVTADLLVKGLAA